MFLKEFKPWMKNIMARCTYVGCDYIINALKEGCYTIFYKFSEDESYVEYLASLKDHSKYYLPQFIYLSTEERFYKYFRYSYGYGFDNYNGFEHQSDAALALLIYLYQIEEEEGSNERSYHYKNNEEKLKSIIDLSSEEREKREEARKEFLSIFGNNQQITPDSNSIKENKARNKVLLELSFSKQEDYVEYEGYPFSLEMKIGREKGRTYVIKNYENFITDLREEHEFKLGSNDSIELTSENFLSPYDEFILLLFKTKIPDYYGSHRLFVSESLFVDMLFCLKGTDISYKGKIYSIDSNIVRGAASLNDKGELIFENNIAGKTKTTYHNGKRAILFDSKEITLIEFENETMGNLFSFYQEYGKEGMNYCNDLFVSKLLPRISSKVIRSKKKDTLLEISLYIELTEKNELGFTTKYSLNGENLTQDNLLSNPYYVAFRENYLRVLSSLGGVENGIVKDEDAILTFLCSDLTGLKELATVYLSDNLKDKTISDFGSVTIRAKKNQGWLKVELDSDKYTPEEIYEILAQYRKKKKFFVLRDEIIKLDDEKLETLSLAADEMQLGKKLVNDRVPFFESLNLNGFLKQGIDIEMDNYLSDAIDDIASFKTASLEGLDSTLSSTLRDYQKDAVKWMSVLSKYSLSGILADDMGLGKTLETIAYVSLIKEDKPVLVVSPKSVIYNWQSEFQRFDKKVKVIPIEGNKEYRSKVILSIQKRKNIYVTSYDSLRNDLPLYENKEFSVFIIDEAQYIKNAMALKTRAVKEIKADHRFALTGTPIENSLSDLWSIFDFLMPGYLLGFDEFQRQYGDTEDENKREFLVKKIQPFLLRRTKNEVLKSLPPKTVNTITVTMSNEQEKIYDAYRQDAKDKMESDEYKDKISILAVLTKLRQICVDPSVLFDNYEEIPSKFSLILDTIRSSIAGGHKLLIFSSFTKVLDHLRDLLDQESISSFYISGATNATARVSLCQRFNTEHKTSVMLVSLKAGGTGLNLQGADIVIHIDPWWNYAAEEQATDRAYRIGQTRPVIVYKYICHNSIEEKVLLLQEQKKELYNAVIKTGDKGLTSLSKDDIKYLIS